MEKEEWVCTHIFAAEARVCGKKNYGGEACVECGAQKPRKYTEEEVEAYREYAYLRGEPWGRDR